MLHPRERAARAGHPRVSLVVSLAIVCLLLASGFAMGADATIGLYQDENGNSCSFNNAVGFTTTYVVVKPGTGGTHGVRFSAPIPSCFDATYIAETVPFLVVGIGNSQTGISLSARDCQTAPFSALSIVYMNNGSTTPCCAYPIVADPFTGTLEAVDCSFAPAPISSNIAHFNANETCLCGPDVPPVPTNPTPIDFAIEQPADQQLSWQVAGFQLGLTYDVYFGTAQTPPLVATGVTAQAYNPGILTLGETYHWQIVSRKPDSSSYPGPVWTFSMAGGGTQTPSNPSPANGAVNVSTIPTLTWLSSVSTFDVYFGTTNPPPLVASNITVHSYNPGTLATSTVYYWRIIAKIGGNSYAGGSWAFSTGNNGPLAPAFPSPSDGASGVSLTPTLTWVASHPLGLPMTFDVYFGTGPTPPLVASNIALTSYQPGTLTPGTYRWRVVARDNQDLETAGQFWTFTTIGVGNWPPSVPSNPFPANNSVINTVQPSFSWLCTDPDTPVLSFLVILGRTPDIWSTLVGIKSTNFPSTNFGILPTGRYYWMVTATDGITSVPGPTWTYVSDLPLAVAFERFGATPTNGTVQVSWELASDEPLSSFVLYRRDGESLQPRVVAEGTLADETGSYLDSSVNPGETYRYELLVRTADGDEFRSPLVKVSLPELTLVLHQNHPNPFNPQTTIAYDIPSVSRVRLLVMDVSGRLVRTLVDENQEPGSRSVVWNGRDDAGSAVSSGVYFYVLDAGKERLTKKLVLLK
jgi:hypothetical protein